MNALKKEMSVLLKKLRDYDESVTSLFDHAFAPQQNPWRNLGSLAFCCLILTIASGIICFAFYDTSVTGAYESGLRLQNTPFYLGRLLRGLHRFGADSCILLSVLHLIREGLRGHYAGIRWFSWLSGLPLLGLIWVAGLTGLWMLWDARSLYSITATAEWLQSLPIGADLLARNFLTPDSLNDRFFSLVMFVHIGVPLLGLATLWIHIQRVAHSRIWPERKLMWTSLFMLIFLSITQPVISLDRADLLQIPVSISLDWFFLFFHPLLDFFTATTSWWIVLGASSFLFALPLLTRHQDAHKGVAVVDLNNCNGCARCVADCPFSAITMVNRTDGSHHRAQALVNADLCASCGICVGACPSSTPFRTIEEMVSGIELPNLSITSLRQQLKNKISTLTGPDKIVVFTCRQAGRFKNIENNNTAVIELECAAMLPPSFLEYTLRMGVAGSVIAGCRQGDCEFRLGDQWMDERIQGLREPYLRLSVDRKRIAMSWSGHDQNKIIETANHLRHRVLTLKESQAL